MDMCDDAEFVYIATSILESGDCEGHNLGPLIQKRALSPRQILQWWGTDYRRAQDPNYWVKRAHEFVKAMHFLPPYPELRPALFVETGTRFENEREWIKALGGNVWHIHRGSDAVLHDHASAVPLPVLPPEREIWNNGTIEELHMAVDMLLSSNVEFVKCEPMEGA